MYKFCNCCNLEKSVEEFNKKNNAKDGLQSKCKNCASDYYDKNKIKILDNSKEYYKKK